MDKIIKKITIITSLLVITFGYTQEKSTYKKDYVKVLITKDWTKDSIIVAKKRLKKAYNIDFNCKDVKYYNNGKVKSLHLYVNSNDGYKGSASTDFFKKGVQFGFFRNYKTFTFTHFGVGFLRK